MSFWSKQKQSVWRIDVYSVIVKEEGGNKENAVEETEENPEEVEDEAIPEEIVRSPSLLASLSLLRIRVSKNTQTRCCV